MYKIVFDQISKEKACLIRTSDSVCIPLDEANTDYQEYLEWLSEGNTPEEAE